MKKIFLLMLLMTACCLIGQAQTATPSKKATLMGPSSQIVDLKTGQVLRTTNAAPTKDLTNIQAPTSQSAGPATFSKNVGSQGKAANQFEVPVRMPVDVPAAKDAPVQTGKSVEQGSLTPNTTFENTIQPNRPASNVSPTNAKNVNQGSLISNPTLNKPNKVQQNSNAAKPFVSPNPNLEAPVYQNAKEKGQKNNN